MLLFALVAGGLAILAVVLAEDPDNPEPRAVPGSVHGSLADEPWNLDDPYGRLEAEDEYLNALLGEPRRGPEFITYEPLRGVL